MKKKEVKKGKWTLKYSQWRDDMGFLVDAYEVVLTKEDGGLVVFPTLVPIMSKTYSGKTDLMDCTNRPTKAQMTKFLNNFIKSFERNCFTLQS